MSRPSAGLYLGFLVFILAIEALLLLVKGAVLIDQHEGDALHVLEIVLRMASGERPHLDFMTPLGVLSFAPIAMFVSFGFGVGLSIMAGSLLFALVLLPAIWWVAITRLSGPVAYFFGAFVVLMATSLVYGGTDQVASISMFYNRWGWSVAFILLALVLLPTDKLASQSADGVILGLGLGFLALAKITFFLAFLPAIAIALVLRGQIRALFIGIAVGLLVAALATLALGFEFWAAYIGDLRAISASPIRAAPGLGLTTLLIGPTFIIANACLIFSVVLLRQSRLQTEGLILLIAAPGFIYVTYQNWGNDPKWLILLAVTLWTLRPDRHLNTSFGWDVARSMGMTALVSLVLIWPTILNITFANLRHARLNPAQFTTPFEIPEARDLAMQSSRLLAPAIRIGIPFTEAKLQAAAEAAKVAPKPVELFGKPLATCKIEMGLIGLLHQTALQIAALPETAGKSVAFADTFSPLWLFGNTTPVPGGAPWFYGDMSAFHRADFLLIPACPVTYRARTLVVDYLKSDRAPNFQIAMENEDFILLRRLPD